ncbi:MAG: hypothetical protein K1X88_09585 [Nannocystaceae bacterium]|nr:hypothetical protein [Nannocystaceae bacterium]
MHLPAGLIDEERAGIVGSWLREARSVARHIAAVLLGILVGGCGDDTVGGSGGGTASTTGELSTTTTTSTTTATSADSGSADSTTGFVPDGEACLPKYCDTVADCCEGVPSSVACPDTYPNNWSCNEAHECVLGACSGDGQCSDLFTGWSCTTVNGTKRCVAGCTVDSDCTDVRNMPGTVCVDSGDAGRRYCVQPT